MHERQIIAGVVPDPDIPLLRQKLIGDIRAAGTGTGPAHRANAARGFGENGRAARNLRPLLLGRRILGIDVIGPTVSQHLVAILCEGADDVGMPLGRKTIGGDRRLQAEFVENVHDAPDAGFPAVVAIRQREAVELPPAGDEIDLTLLFEGLERNANGEGNLLLAGPAPCAGKSGTLCHECS